MDQPLHDRPRRAPVLGVLGGIASGKSEFARALAGPGGVYIDADRLAHQALERPEIAAWIAERAGPGALRDGRVDRPALAAAVFADAGLRRELEQRVHPLVRAEIRAQLEAALADPRVERVVLDVPLLLEHEAEHGLAGLCDALVFVDADAKVRDARAVARRGWRSGELARREAAQMPLERKRARAEFLVLNDGELDALRAQARQVLAAFEARRSAP